MEAVAAQERQDSLRTKKIQKDYRFA